MKILLFSLISWKGNPPSSAGSANQPSQKNHRKGNLQSSAGSANQPSQKNRSRQTPEPKPEIRAPPVTLSAQPLTNNTVCSQKRCTLCVKRPDHILLRCWAWCQNKAQFWRLKFRYRTILSLDLHITIHCTFFLVVHLFQLKSSAFSVLLNDSILPPKTLCAFNDILSYFGNKICQFGH